MRCLVLISLLVAAGVSAQTQQIIFLGESGDALLQLLEDNYRPETLLSESATKDVIMDEIYRENDGGPDGVFGVYTREFVPFDGLPSPDPNQDIFNNGNGLNQEHIWPRSQLGGGTAVPSERDMHHLVPTGVEINADRGSFPFAEIDDILTTTWYRFDQEQSTIPDASIIDEFSELRANTSFEPREDFSGNVARAMFYVATMYPDEANMAFFTAAQQRALYEWHYADPVDATEQARTQLIAAHQSDKPNPFTLDSTLIRRAYYPEIVTDIEVPAATQLLLSLPTPQPFRTETSFTLTLREASSVKVDVFDALGRLVTTLHNGTLAGNTPIRITLDGSSLSPGLYIVRAVTGRSGATRRLIRAR